MCGGRYTWDNHNEIRFAPSFYKTIDRREQKGHIWMLLKNQEKIPASSTLIEESAFLLSILSTLKNRPIRITVAKTYIRRQMTLATICKAKIAP